jgi:hypothetical protein
MASFQARISIPLDEVASVDVADGTVSKSKVGATLAFGVLGATGSRGTKTEVSVVAHLKSGATAYFLIPDSKEGRLAVRAKAGPILQRRRIPFADQLPASETAPVGIADQLRKLKELRDEGVLSPEEFEKAKAKLLDQPFRSISLSNPNTTARAALSSSRSISRSISSRVTAGHSRE